ncbi:unnamed protein product, partial [marine sediment metagenome]
IDTLALSSETNGPLTVTPSILAMNYVDASGGITTPNYDDQVTDPILMHHGLTLTVGGSAIELHSLGINIVNNLDGDHFVNSQTRTVIPEGRREIDLTMGLDWDVATMTTRAIWTNFLAGDTAALIATYSDGSSSVTLSFPYVTYSGIPAGADGPDAVAVDVTASADDSGPALSDAMTVSGL